MVSVLISVMLEMLTQVNIFPSYLQPFYGHIPIILTKTASGTNLGFPFIQLFSIFAEMSF